MTKYKFLENKEWYYRSKDGKYLLMPVAPAETKQSYEHYLADLETSDTINNITNDLKAIRDKYRKK